MGDVAIWKKLLAEDATGWSEPIAGRKLHPLKSSAFSRRSLSTTTGRGICSGTRHSRLQRLTRDNKVRLFRLRLEESPMLIAV
jgi:hypothetical protein